MISSGRRNPARAQLSRQRVLEVGMALIEAHGVDALSMRALAEELDVAPMSLYRHVRNKDDLLQGILSLVLDQIELEIPDVEGWSEQAAGWMQSLREQLRSHPAAVSLLMQHGHFAAALLRATNTLLSILLGAGFEGRQAVLACREISWATLGFVASEIPDPIRSLEPRHDAINGSPYALLESLPAAEVAEVAKLIPYFLERDMDEVFASSARHLLAGLELELELCDAKRNRTAAASG